MLGGTKEINAYIASVDAPSCTESPSAKIATLMNYVDDLKGYEVSGCDTDSALLERVLDKVEEAMREKDGKGSDVAAAKKEEKLKESYNDNGDCESWEPASTPEVTFSDVIGSSKAVEMIREAIIIPVKFPDFFSRSGADPWRGGLLYGPPGTGKSMLAKAAANEAQVNFFDASCAELTSKWVGGSEKLVRSLFATARSMAPSLIFLDEIDSIASSRERDKSTADQRLTNQLLIEIDANTQNKAPVFVLAATNLPWTIDPAVMRRLPKKIYIPLPTTEDRKNILHKRLNSVAEVNENVLQQIAEMTDGFSGSDIVSFCNELLLQPMRRFVHGTSFFVKRDDSGDIESIELFASQSGDTGERVDCDFYTLANKYGETKLKQPAPETLAILTTLTSFRQNVCSADVSRFESFMTA